MKYLELVKVYEKLEATTKRLEKTYYISEFLKRTSPEDLNEIVLLLQARLYPSWDERKTGVASKLVIKAIATATGLSGKDIEKEWKKTGDLGIVTEKLISRKKQTTLLKSELTVKKVFNNLRKLPELEGVGSVEQKIQAIAELLTSAKPLEAKYIIRTILEELRVGVGAGSIRDAIVWAYFPKIIGIFFKCNKCRKWVPNSAKCIECSAPIENKFNKEIQKFREKNILFINKLKDLEKKDLKKYQFILTHDERLAREAYNYLVETVQKAYDLTNDFSSVAKTAKKGIKELKEIVLEVGKPIKVMLAIKAKGMEDAFDRVGRPAALEYKYDGFRMQISKKDSDIKIYTRRLENVTKQFPEVKDNVKNNVKGKSFVIDCEAVGYSAKTKKYLPFQNISQRIKRKYGIGEMSKNIPVELNIFDIIYYEGKNLIKKPFNERRALLEKIVNPVKKKIVLANQIVTGDISKAKKFYKEALAKGHEGIIMKKMDAPYKPGARVGYMVKVKPTMETLDLVIIGAEWGAGKRATWLSSFTLACRDEKGNFLGVGKVGTGIKEKKGEGVTFHQLTKLLTPLVVKERGKEVKIKPAIVVEITYEEIQKSPTYASGYALRFPRLLRIRYDKPVDEVSNLKTVKELYKGQRKS